MTGRAHDPRRTGMRRAAGFACSGARWLTALLAGCLLLAGCSITYTSTPVPSPPPSAGPLPPSPQSAPRCGNPLASYAPLDPMPSPNDMPVGSTMARIHARGRLIAGVSADTYMLGSRDPINGRIEGFDIDMVKMIAQAIFGDPHAYELRVIDASQRLSVLESHQVDIVARAMTIDCRRWQYVAFSTEYYRAGQKLLIRRGEKITGIHDLAGRRVCAPRGTSSIVTLARLAPKAIIVPADTHTGCLVLFERQQVDAITGDDTVLAGLAAQDPYAVVLQHKAFTVEPYGIGIPSDDVDMVRFVNAALERMRTDGRWTASYNRWLAPALGPAPAPPQPVYGRTP